MSQLGARSFAIALGAVLSIAGIDGHGQGKPWTYAGRTGPAKWDTLNKDFAACKEGYGQSPIDIPDASTRKGDFPPILFNYKPVPLKLIDKGHTLQLNYARGSIATIDGVPYKLVQFDFHRPSEHKIDGKGHDMEVQLAHRGPDGKLVVIVVLLEAGRDNPFIKTLLNHLPKEKGKEIVVDGVKINAVNLLPNDKGYYAYTGSLTTPPCSEDVTWFILKSTVPVAAGDLARFGKAFPANARPVQPVNGRDIRATP